MVGKLGWFTVGKLGLQTHLVVTFLVPECIIEKDILGTTPAWDPWLTESPIWHHLETNKPFGAKLTILDLFHIERGSD